MNVKNKRKKILKKNFEQHSKLNKTTVRGRSKRERAVLYAE